MQCVYIYVCVYIYIHMNFSERNFRCLYSTVCFSELKTNEVIPMVMCCFIFKIKFPYLSCCSRRLLLRLKIVFNAWFQLVEVRSSDSIVFKGGDEDDDSVERLECLIDFSLVRKGWREEMRPWWDCVWKYGLSRSLHRYTMSDGGGGVQLRLAKGVT